MQPGNKFNVLHSSVNISSSISGCLGIVLLPCQSFKTSRWTGPSAELFLLLGGVHLRQRLAVEALPPDALRRLPPVPVVAAADGAVIHLHIDSCRDDRCSGEAIWTCRMGEKGGAGDSKEGLRMARNEALLRASLFFWRNGGLKQRTGGVRGADVQILLQACIGGLVFATLKRFC